MNGVEMARKILEIAPRTKILLMSGYSDDSLEYRGRQVFIHQQPDYRTAHVPIACHPELLSPVRSREAK